jgi:probable HAF family extracellular repeat protein
MATSCGLRTAAAATLPMLLTVGAAPVTAGAAPVGEGGPRVTVTEIRAPEGYRPAYDATGDGHLIDDGWVAFEAYSEAPDVPPGEWRRIVVRDPQGGTRLVPAPAAVANDISGRGEVVGSAAGFECSGVPSCEQPFVWRRGSAVTILPTAGRGGAAGAVNDRGQVVGAMVRAEPAGPAAEWTAVVWDRGRTLVPPEDRPSTPVGIDDRGRVAMNVGELPFGSRAAVWRPGGGVTEVGTLGLYGSFAVAANERGDVAGAGWTAEGAVHGFVWRDGEMIDLGTLGGEESQVYDINDRGQVVGSSETADGVEHAFLWEDGEMTDLGTLDGFPTSRPRAINDGGQVVGTSYGQGDERPFLWHDGEMTDLGRVAADAGFDASGAVVSDIDDRGRIVGSGTSRPPGAGEPARHVLLWTVR